MNVISPRRVASSRKPFANCLHSHLQCETRQSCFASETVRVRARALVNASALIAYFLHHFSGVPFILSLQQLVVVEFKFEMLIIIIYKFILLQMKKEQSSAFIAHFQCNKIPIECRCYACHFKM